MSVGLEPLRPVATLRSNAKAPLSSCQAGASIRPVIFQSALAPAAPPCVRSALPPRPRRPPQLPQSLCSASSTFLTYSLIVFISFSPLSLPPAAVAHRHEHSPEGNLLLPARGQSSAFCPAAHPEHWTCLLPFRGKPQASIHFSFVLILVASVVGITPLSNPTTFKSNLLYFVSLMINYS